MIGAMLVDDEPLAREELARLIADSEDFQIVSEASSGEEAIGKLKEKKVDVVFLDVEMPRMNGLEVASRLLDWPEPPLVVFATAYHQYAIEAFETSALDYILKPYDPERLKKTLERVKEQLHLRKSSQSRLANLEADLIKSGMLKKIIGHHRHAKDRIVLSSEDIYYFYTDLAEVRVRTKAEELIVNSTLRELLNSLDPVQFVQTHKSYVVNINKIAKVAPLFNGNFEILLNDQNLPKIPLSRRYAKALKGLLGGW